MIHTENVIHFLHTCFIIFFFELGRVQYNEIVMRIPLLPSPGAFWYLILDQNFVSFVVLPSCYTFFLLYFVILSSDIACLDVMSITCLIFNVTFCNIREVTKIVLYTFQQLNSWSGFAFCFILSYVFILNHGLINFFRKKISLKSFLF